VNAREQLKRYLEQRRDMGETELVLDGLTVDEALRILGANAAASRSADRRESAAPTASVSVEREAPVGASVDWRETLRAAGAGPGELMAAKPANPTGSGAAAR
jgi:DNA polymerase